MASQKGLHGSGRVTYPGGSIGACAAFWCALAALLALSRAVAVHPTATAGRAVDQVNANTAEREARAGMGDDDLIPRLRAV